jgi:DNA-binding NarL/FixJ family response regulator
MERSPLVRVVILYAHPILGEGLARLLGAEPGVAAVAMSEFDATSMASALASRPDVVIVESSDPDDLRAIPSRRDRDWPLVLHVDIDGTRDTRVGGAAMDDLERVVRAVRDLQSARTLVPL